MKNSNRFLFIVGCVLSAYAIVGTILHWPANKFCATMSVTFLTFALVRAIGAISGNKKSSKV